MGKIYTADNFVKSSGTSSQFLKADGSVDSTAYQVTGDYITSLTGEVTASGAGAASATLNNASVTGKVLTGVNVTGGSISATDSILSAFGKVQNQINGLIGGSIYQSVWNASTNTPTLTTSVGTKGYYYIVNVAGSTNLNGITDWKIGDWAIYDGTAWQKVDNTDAVSSVNGFTGAVSLTTANISEVTNLYYTEARVNANTNVTANTAARHNAVTLGTNQNGLSLSTQVLSLGLASTSTNGALSSTDWNTFNGKQNALTNPVTGTGATNTVPKFTGTNAIGNSIITDSGAIVDILANSSASIDTRLSVSSTGNGGAGRGTAILMKVPGSSSSADGVKINAYTVGGAVAAQSTDLAFDVGLSGTLVERMRITSTGNVGIGTTTVPNTLSVGMASSTTGKGISLTSSAGIEYARFGVINSTVDNTSFIGSISNNHFAIYANNAERMRITSGGDIGVGTTTPSVKLDIVGTANTFASIGTTGASSGRALLFQDKKVTATKYNWLIGSQYNVDNAFEITPSTAVGGSTYSSPSITILQTGKVGIGTTSPASILNIVENVNSNSSFIIRNANAGSSAYANVIVRNDANQGVELGMQSTTRNSTYPLNEGWLYASNGLNLGYVGDTKIYAGSTEKMRITSGGNVLIGTTTDAGYKLDVAGTGRVTGSLTINSATTPFLYFHSTRTSGQSGYIKDDGNMVFQKTEAGGGFRFLNSSSAVVLSIDTGGASTFINTVTATGFFNSSDIRLKEIVDYDYSVSDIKPITYLWKDGRDDKKHVGYSAQEVQKVMPDAVNEGTDGMLSVNYVEVLVAKIAELESRIKQLEK